MDAVATSAKPAKSAPSQLAKSLVERIAPSGLMKPDQAAEYLQITPSTLAVWRSTNRKKLAFVKIGGQVRYRREDLDKFIVDGLRNAA